MKVSIIMSVYNGEAKGYLNKALDSILKQTHKNMEIVICNDSSTDNTLDILSEFKKNNSDNYEIIIINNKENLGLAASLNKCISMATGKYLGRMDADDFMDEMRIEKQVEFLETNSEYAFVSTNAKYFNDDGVWGSLHVKEFPQKRDMLSGSPFVHAASMLRKDAILKVGGYRVAKETIRAEDYDLWMRFYAEGFIGANLNYYGYYIREDEEALKRRKYIYRYYESIVRYKGFKELELLPSGFIYVLKPLIVGLIPLKITKVIRKYRKN